MERRGEQIVESETEASAGSKEGVVRWVLIIGLVLAIGFLSIIWMTGALVQDDGPDSETSVSTRIQTQEPAADRGEPIPPAMEGAEAEAAATPDPASTPGDAPAGDPQPIAN